MTDPTAPAAACAKEIATEAAAMLAKRFPQIGTAPSVAYAIVAGCAEKYIARALPAPPSPPDPATDALAERVGLVADRADAIAVALTLPIPAATHVECLRSALPEIRDELRAIVVAMTGEDPWKD